MKKNEQREKYLWPLKVVSKIFSLRHSKTMNRVLVGNVVSFSVFGSNHSSGPCDSLWYHWFPWYHWFAFLLFALQRKQEDQERDESRPPPPFSL
jgi:hypothetical protein